MQDDGDDINRPTLDYRFEAVFFREFAVHVTRTQISKKLLLTTMKTIASLYGTDPKKATTLQMHFIQYVRGCWPKPENRLRR